MTICAECAKQSSQPKSDQRRARIGCNESFLTRLRCPGPALLFSIALAVLLFPATANTKNCFMVDYENAPAATVSGRITAHHRVPKGSELRAAHGPFLNLDTPLLTADGGDTEQCLVWRKIVIMSHDDDPQLAKWTNQHVIIFGQLNRFGSALVDPAIFIKVKTIKKGSLPPRSAHH